MIKLNTDTEIEGLADSNLDMHCFTLFLIVLFDAFAYRKLEVGGW